MNSKIKKYLSKAIFNNDINIAINNLSMEERIFIVENFLQLMDLLPFNERDYSDDEVAVFFSKLLTTEEKKVILNSQFENFHAESKCIFLYEFPDESKAINELKKIQNFVDPFFLRYVLTSFKSDESKMNNEVFENLPLAVQTDVISSLSSDETKMDLIDGFESDVENYKRSLKVIVSLKSDEIKERIIKDASAIFFEEDIAKIISSLKDENLKIELLKNITLEENRAMIIKTFKSDELKCRCIKDFNVPYYKLKVILILESDELKLEELKKDDFGPDAFPIINSLKSDELKIKELKSSENIWERSALIASLKDNNKIIEQMALDEDFNEIIKYFNFFLIKTNKVNSLFVEKFSLLYNLVPSHVETVIQKFGYEYFYDFNNRENIIELLKLSDDHFYKVMKMFDAQKSLSMTNMHVANICNSISQREYRIKHPEVLRTFAEIKILADKKDKNSILEIINSINNVINVEEFISEYNINIDTLVNGLINEDAESFNIVHNLTDSYINLKRDEYSRKRTEELKSSFDFEKSYEKNYLLNRFLMSSKETIKTMIYQIPKEKLNEEQIKFLSNIDLVEKCIEFKKDPKRFSSVYSKSETIEVQKRLKSFTNILEILYFEEKLNIFGQKDPEAKVILNVAGVENRSIINIINSINMKQISEKLLDTEYYDKLIKILFTQRIMGWGEKFNEFLENADLIFDEETIATFINYFYKFYPELEEKVSKNIISSISLATLIDEAGIYDSASYKHKILLGSEDFKLISTNPSPNAASSTKSERLESVPELVKKMYQKEFITIPPINMDIEASSGKKINVSIGNFTNPRNLTLGERTGSCMRIGGVGSTLFNYTIRSENGFHVILTDPLDNTFISRVSGFRNGNTVVLNELRDSLEPQKFNNYDLISAIRELSKTLVEQTKDSAYPIDNVIISAGYAMRPVSSEVVDTKVDDITGGLDTTVYTDVKRSNTLLLASSSQDGSLVPVKTGVENLPKYKVARSGIKFIDNYFEIREKMFQIELYDQLLSGISFREATLQEHELSMYDKLYVGEDWYILVDENGVVKEEYRINRDTKKQSKEMQEIIQLIENNKIEGSFRR